MPRIELVEVGERDRALLDNLAQLYQYDFSEFAGGDVGPDGRFSFVDFDELFSRPMHHAYIVRVDGQIAGFATAYREPALRDPDESTWWMHEFFVMRKYRRQGVGERVATTIFERLGGAWEVGELPSNTAAQSFWRAVIGRYTGGSYEEFELDDERWSGPIQYFAATGKG